MVARLLLTVVLSLQPILGQVSPYGFPRLLQSERAIQQIREDGTLGTVCSGSTIGDGYHVLTAAHCTDEDVFINGERARVVYRDEDLDLSVIWVTSYAPPLRVQQTPPQFGQKVTIVGHPVGLPVQWFRGYISNPDTLIDSQHYLMLDATVCGGNSGSAITNDKDEIVSVLQIGFGRPCSGFSGGSLWATTARVIAKYGKAAPRV